ncbi:hypothetical protein ACXN5S_09120 [Pseudoroseicyclus sp. H15]
MTSILRSAGAPLVLLAALAACSSSSGPKGPDVPAFSDFNQAIDYADNVLDVYASSRALPIDQLPQNGTASYEGFVLITEQSPGANTAAIGGVGMELDFANERLTGRADNFVAHDNTEVSGHLDLAGKGIEDDFGAVIGVRLNGSLRGAAGYTQRIDENVLMGLGVDRDEDTMIVGEAYYQGTSLVSGQRADMGLGIIALED